MIMRRELWMTIVATFLATLAGELDTVQGAEPLYRADFEKVEVDKEPEGLLILQGSFNVKEAQGEKFLELPGAPLETFGFLFGPNEKAGVGARARFYGTGKGRRFPTFALGLNGQSGFRLQVSPSKKLLELFKGEEEVVASMPFTWESGSWTELMLQVVPVGTKWVVRGKAWKHGTTEPKDWSVTHEETVEPRSGQAAAFGSPYAGTPIRFDDLIVTRVE